GEGDRPDGTRLAPGGSGGFDGGAHAGEWGPSLVASRTSRSTRTAVARSSVVRFWWAVTTVATASALRGRTTASASRPPSVRVTRLARASCGSGSLVTQPRVTRVATVPDIVGWRVRSSSARRLTPHGPYSSSRERTRTPAGGVEWMWRREARTRRAACITRSL